MSELKWKRGPNEFHPDAYQHAFWMGLTYSLRRTQSGSDWWYTLHVDGTYLRGGWVMRDLKAWLAGEIGGGRGKPPPPYESPWNGDENFGV